MEILSHVFTKTSDSTAVVATVSTSPDVWQQLHSYQVGPRFTQLIEYLVGLPDIWSPHTHPPLETEQPMEILTATIPPPSNNDHILALPVAPEGTQLFGLFISRYFVLALVIGFIISRIHVLVHRQRVRPLSRCARIMVYLPTHLLLLRALSSICMALNKTDKNTLGHTVPWMQTPIAYVSKISNQYQWISGQGNSGDDVAYALWLCFATICLFDCIDVFVARLEGSPCAPYEYIGGLIERTSLYYFYGGSLRIQELVLLGVVEKLLLSHMLILVTNGWQWRLVPTGMANLLTLNHFVFSMRNYSGPQAMYPFVQVLSMVLLGVSLLIVTTTVCIRWLAFTIDRLGIKRHRLSGISGGVDNVRTAVAVYDRNGAFQGVRVRNSVDGDGVDIDNNNGGDEDEDESLYELTQYSSLPLYPDLRRDFGVEILDLAGTCLQQYSNQVRSSGFSRQYGAMRVPLTTALDQYIDKAVTRIDGSDRQRQVTRQQGQGSQKRVVRKPGSGLSVFIDDEPSVPIALQPSSANIAAALHDTRADAVRRLSVSVWSLCIALGTYALSRKMHVVGQVDENNSTGDVSGQNIRKKQKCPHTSWRQSTSSSQQDISDGNETECFGQESGGLIDIDDLEWDDDDDDDDGDFDYVAVVDESDSDSETESGESGSNSESRSERFNEAAELVSDLLDHPDDKDDGSQLLASATAFIAHSLLDGIFPGLSGVVGTRPRVMTRGMITRQLLSGDRAGTSMADQDHIESVIVGPETLLAQMLSRITNNSMGQTTGGTQQQQQQQQQTVRYGELPFEPNEMESLAQLIHVKRQQHEQQPVATQANSDDGNSMVGDAVLCVICWANARSVMLRPCRCLCLCNDCRQALAARNFDHCPCCRRAVSGYSRVYAV